MNARSRFSLIVCAAVALLHCSDGDDSPRPPAAPQPDGSTLPTIDGGVSSGDASTGTDGGDIPAQDAELSFSTVESTPCKPTTAAPVALLPDESDVYFTDLATVGARRVARGTNDEGFVVFEASGSALPAPVFAGYDTKIVGGSSSFAIIRNDEGSVRVRSFDATGAPASPERTLAKETAYSLAVGRSGEDLLGVWSTGDAVRARVVTGVSATASETFDLESDVAKEDFSARATASKATDGSTFAVAWAVRRSALGQHRLYFALVKAGAMVGLPLKLYGSPERIQVSGLAATASGYTILLNLDGEAAVASLTARGLPAGPGHRFKGGRDALVGAGLSLATRDDAVLLGAERDSAQTAVRVLELSGKPKGGWVCLTTPDPDAYQFVSVDSDGAGYAAIAATPGGGTAFFKLDATANEP